MSYTIGLDFGTHQTKICIENASNPAQKTYYFYEHETPSKKTSLYLPSVIQINDDDTVSYGFVDENRCKIDVIHASAQKPIQTPQKKIIEKLIEKPIKKPQLILPAKRSLPKPTLREWQRRKRQSARRTITSKIKKNWKKSWEDKCRSIDEKNQKLRWSWELQCASIEADYRRKLEEYEKLIQERKEYVRQIKEIENNYQRELENWERRTTPMPLRFRYFKLATFSNFKWGFPISAVTLSTWYITYILLKLRENYPNDFVLQLGYPSSLNVKHSSIRKKKAEQIYLASMKLMEEYDSLDLFLNANYQDLLNQTQFLPLEEITDEYLNNFSFIALPEAYAGLRSITTTGRVSKGMHLLVDIGGGTTDVALFTVKRNGFNRGFSDIHAVYSFDMGLNSIFEEYITNNKSLILLQMPEIQEKFRQNSEKFHREIGVYKEKLKNKVNQIINQIFKSLRNLNNLDATRLNIALENQPIVYNGGGSLYEEMRFEMLYFNDILQITSDVLNIPNLINLESNSKINDDDYTILSTSYGLSIAADYDREGDIERNMIPINNIFDHLISLAENTNDNWRKEYGMIDVE